MATLCFFWYAPSVAMVRCVRNVFAGACRVVGVRLRGREMLGKLLLLNARGRRKEVVNRSRKSHIRWDLVAQRSSLVLVQLFFPL